MIPKADWGSGGSGAHVQGQECRQTTRGWEARGRPLPAFRKKPHVHFGLLSPRREARPVCLRQRTRVKPARFRTVVTTAEGTEGRPPRTGERTGPTVHSPSWGGSRAHGRFFINVALYVSNETKL